VPSDGARRRELAEELEEEGRVALEAASREGERGRGEPQLSRLAYVRAEAVRGADTAGACFRVRVRVRVRVGVRLRVGVGVRVRVRIRDRVRITRTFLLVRELGEAVPGAAERREQPREVLWLG